MNTTGEHVLAVAEVLDIGSDVTELVVTGTIAAFGVAAMVITWRNWRRSEDSQES